MAIRRPRLKPQMLDPTTTLDPYLCTMESGAMGLDVLTGGKINVWGGQLVPYCGRSPALIKQKGTNLHNVDNAWAHWGKNLDIRTGHTWLEALQDLNNGYWLIMQGDYDQFTFATKCQDSFFGDHAVIVGPEHLKDFATLAGDPLCRNFIYIPRLQLQHYTQKLGRRVYMQLYGRWSGQIFYARIRPAAGPAPTVSPHYSSVVTIATSLWNDGTDKWVYNNPAGPTDNRVKVGTKLEVRSARYVKGGVSCYPVTSGTYSKNYAGYYVPAEHVRLISRLT